MTRGRAHHRRGSALALALAVVVLGVAAAVAMIASASADLEASEASWQRQRLRSAAMSGVRVAAAELALQRRELLRGEDPRLTESVLVFAVEGQRGRARLVPVGGLTARPESAKLDVNRATAEMLGGLPGVGPETAGLIEAARGAGFESVESLAGVRGLGPAEVYGAADGAVVDGSAGESAALADLLTVFGFDADETRDGRASVEGGGDASLLPEGVRAVVERLGGAWKPYPSRAELVGALLREGVAPESWGEVLDSVAAGGERFPWGRVDVNRASASVLAVLPGMDASTADALVAAREGLSAERRADVAWPVVEGVVPAERFAALSDWVTTRSMVWRIRVEAVIEADAEGAEETGSSAAGSSMTVEAVIDLTEARPRIAYLREVGWLDAAVELAEATRREAESGPETALGSTEEDPEGERFAGLELGGLSGGGGLSLGGGLDLGASRAEDASVAREGGESADRVERSDVRIGRWRAREVGGADRRSEPR